MKITIYTHYNERRNQLTKATAEVVDILPEVGTETNGGLYKIDNIVRIDPDIATYTAFPDVVDYDIYWVHEIDNSGDPNFADSDDEYYLAVRKPED